MLHKASTLGIFVSGTTMFTVLSGKNPVGMSGAAYDLDDVKDRERMDAIQQVIWDVVSGDRRTGLSPTVSDE